jgi:GNAT superfamily N-acetyltransferase
VDDPVVSGALLEAVRGWAQERGLRTLRGPMNPTTNDECGLLIDGFGSPPVLMMTYNPPYYSALLEQAGLSKARDLLAYHIDLSRTPMNRFQRLADKVRARNPELSFRPVRRRTLNADLDKVKEVYNAAWADNWGFTPMTDAEVDFLALRLKPLFTEGLVWLAEERSEPIGFLLAVLDFNVALQPLRGRFLSPGLFRALPYFLRWKTPRMCRVMTLGVKERHRGRGLESVMLYEGLQVGCRLGLESAEASWILEDNTAMRRMLEVFGARVYKTYRIYEGPADRAGIPPASRA